MTRFLLMAFLAFGRLIPTTTIPERQMWVILINSRMIVWSMSIFYSWRRVCLLPGCSMKKKAYITAPKQKVHDMTSRASVCQCAQVLGSLLSAGCYCTRLSCLYIIVEEDEWSVCDGASTRLCGGCSLLRTAGVWAGPGSVWTLFSFSSGSWGVGGLITYVTSAGSPHLSSGRGSTLFASSVDGGLKLRFSRFPFVGIRCHVPF